jgi:peptidyl-prolyl cis-trans isomerase C
MRSRNALLIFSLLSSAIIHAETGSPTFSGDGMTDYLNQALGIKATPKSSPSPISLPDPVAIVNGQKISSADLQKAFADAAQRMGIPTDHLTKEQLQAGYREILDVMILDKLVRQQAKGIVVESPEIEAQLAKVKATFPSQKAFDQEIAKTGLNEIQYKANLASNLRQSKWVQSQLPPKGTVTEADAKQYYDSHQKDFTHPEMVKLNMILCQLPQNPTPQQSDAAEKKASEAIARLRKGDQFSTVAFELSDDRVSKMKGGALGYLPKEGMNQEFAKAAFALQPGVVSPTPVKTKIGYVVMLADEFKPAGTVSYEEAKPQVIALLESQQRKLALVEINKRLRQSAKIEIFLPNAS